MATAENTTVNLYKGVPLTKNGTEVLFLSGGAAAAALSGYLAHTFSRYYYTRENRGAVQVESPIDTIEGCNYIGFQNVSHGGKWFFGFIDRIVYINDNNTQVEFTIDPFATYLDDASFLDEYFVVRNTPISDTRGSNVAADYMPTSPTDKVEVLANLNVALDDGEVYFAAGQITAAELGTTGIKIGALNDNNLQAILQNGGTIIGAYQFPSGWYSGVSTIRTVIPMGTLQGNPFSGISAFTHNKIRTGVYTKVLVVTTQGSKTYEPEAFADPTNVQFQMVGLTLPSPALFVYPLNYHGIAHNIAEGLMCKAPALPISANAVYTNAQKFADITGAINGVVSGGISGAARGGLAGAAIGAGQAALSSVWNAGVRETMTKYSPPTVYGTGEPVVNLQQNMSITLCSSHPDAFDLNRIDKYFDYFGYACNCMNTALMLIAGGVNTNDMAFLQTGSDALAGSEADDELNTRLKAGIKIKKTL